MRGIDLIAGFELEINKLDNALEKPVTDDSLYWLNQAIVKFAKERFNGNLPHRTSYEQNEKRARDLINLYTTYTMDLSSFPVDEDNPSYDRYGCSYDELPYPLMFLLNEDVIISDLEDGHKMNTCVFECTQDSFMYRVNNSLTDFHYRFHRARPLRVRTANGFDLLTDKNYKILSYTIGYIRIPEEITDDPEQEYTDFQEYIWPEIIKIAAQMYVENKSDQRYKTLTNEVLTQE